MSDSKINNHIPVLLNEVVEYLKPKAGERYLDLTAGYGGHASAIIARTAAPDQATLVDRDMNAVQALNQKLPKSKIVQANAAEYLTDSLDVAYDIILADIGVSSPHIDVASRGFSFMTEGPLDMRMDQSQQLTAETVVNAFSEVELADILYTYGDEKFSRRIAHEIIKNRPLYKTTELAGIIRGCLGTRKSAHPEARSFQALRVFVNDEIRQLEVILAQAPFRLNPGGRLGIISFHSLEDRLIKQKFSELGQNTYDSQYRLLTKKPISPSNIEIVSNPRARSAKLRVLQRK
ncbi:16S rRNA (cytosine(1402)-N(4))-methyltransferase RsmH [Candidatus Saccharibacteria bacterium]|nr:16S rRNA (cytosine(1402)-N(4))-methyltransferase RsmH [Candidatus Saccharibacteria bacterium]MCB9821384.1 16S rRNA (cytosine(1402)-N(4))-methyltransferase RsmH [Candidatus Nomurabacteria bacterium]